MCSSSNALVRANIGGQFNLNYANLAQTSVFKERGTALGWHLLGQDSNIEAMLGSEQFIEEIPEDEPTIPDLDLP